MDLAEVIGAYQAVMSGTSLRFAIFLANADRRDCVLYAAARAADKAGRPAC
jgi:hypothetical protein